MEYVKEDIKTLYEQRKKFIEESNYIKAEEISKKINNYKSFQMKKQQRELAQKKESEQNNFEKSYSEELFLFKQRWSKIEEEFQNDIKLKIKELKKRQKLELNEFIKNITEREIKQKITPNYINLKKVEEELVKQERFLEAEQIKHQAEKVLKKENNLMEIEYQQKIKKQIQLFKNRQNEEYDKIINKYRAFKVEMMLRQKDEETRAKKMLQKAFRAGKRSMSQEIKSNSNYFK